MFYLESPIRLKQSSAQGAAGRFWNFSASLRAYVCRIDQKAVAGGTMWFLTLLCRLSSGHLPPLPTTVCVGKKKNTRILQSK